jgi:Uma2 family endonuclease
MNVALKGPMTLESFLVWEDKQPLRYEFDGTRPVAMTGGTAAHAAIQRNLLVALTLRLRGKPCQAHGSQLKIQVAGRIRYPDAFVVCSPLAADAKVVTEPVAVFEVTSKSTENEDLVDKNAECRATPSVQHYVILQQSKPRAIVFTRKGEEWVSTLLTSADASLNLPEIGCSFPLGECYADMDLGAASAA